MRSSTITWSSLLLLIVFWSIGEVVAQDGPLPPDVAFRYTIVDTGNSVQLRWNIEEGYYLYKDKIRVQSLTPSVEIDSVVLPRGISHSDQFFGQQEIYRGDVVIDAPYSIEGERPRSIRIQINSQGCADIGLCYPPQSWVSEVAHAYGRQGEAGVGDQTGQSVVDEPGVVDSRIEPRVEAIDGNTLKVSWQIARDAYLPRESIAVNVNSDAVDIGRLEMPEGVRTNDFDELGKSEVYFETVVGRLPLARHTKDPITLDLTLTYAECSLGQGCAQTTHRNVRVELPRTEVVTPTNASPDLSEQDQLALLITESNIVWVIASFFGLGLLLSLTPCVLPMVPILSAIIAGDSAEASPSRGLTLAVSYVLGMSIVYTAAGVLAVAAGTQVQAVFNQPWMIVTFAALFVFLAVAMFGGYDLQLPSSLQSRIVSVSGNQRTGTTAGAFVMGALSALVVTACVAPALVAALTVMAQTGDMLRGGVSLFSMSLGMGAPLLLVGAAQGRLLPKTGPWMVAVKNGFGFMLLGIAIWMLSRLLDSSVILFLWGLLVYAIGVYLGGLTQIQSSAGRALLVKKAVGVLVMLYGVVLIGGAIAGANDPLSPLDGFGARVSGQTEQHQGLRFQRVKSVDELNQKLDEAARNGQTAMLDFYADWCVSCKEMEATTFSDPKVQSVLENTMLLQADVTRNDTDDKALLNRFGLFGPPTILFFDARGRELDRYEVVGYMAPERFYEHVKTAFQAESGDDVRAGH